MDNDDITIDMNDGEVRGNAARQASSEEDIEAAESRADAKSVKLKKELEVCRAERQEYLDGWQRAKADYVNALKRAEEERSSARVQGMMKAAEAFLPAIDSLARAEGLGDVPEGFAAIAKQLHDAVSRLGLVPFGEPGEAFDPMLHDALGQDTVSSKEEDNTVTAVLEAGWKTAEQVVRPAKVRVGHFEG